MLRYKYIVYVVLVLFFVYLTLCSSAQISATVLNDNV